VLDLIGRRVGIELTRCVVWFEIYRFLARKEWYQERGIPHRRGILLYGEAGSGKTSIVSGEFIQIRVGAATRSSFHSTTLRNVPLTFFLRVEAISSELSINIYVLDLSADGENSFRTLSLQLPGSLAL